MIACWAGLTSNCVSGGGAANAPFLVDGRPGRRPSTADALEGDRRQSLDLLGTDRAGEDDDEDALIEGWLEKRGEGKLTRWLWQNRFFRLEPGPQLLSCYRSEIWQGCRRCAAYDLMYLSGAHAETVAEGSETRLWLEFLSAYKSADMCSFVEDVDIAELRVPGGPEVALEWQNHLLRCVEDALVEACCATGNTCGEGLGGNAFRIVVRAQMAKAEDRPCIDMNRRHDNRKGATVLMLAAQAGHVELCAQLLSAHADPALQDDEGRTAACLARNAGHENLLALLSHRGDQKRLLSDVDINTDSLRAAARGPPAPETRAQVPAAPALLQPTLFGAVSLTADDDDDSESVMPGNGTVRPLRPEGRELT
eukprot:gnl/TRDRNA2_/TRDRNA2_95896_c0_seq2.p1 gnl/TRDRNA2_/TRDRNA2_95896_c0~~gnl/TRDRNA2_/TRDRNA2_95896_c0_seq2.p1  ORF type:complete len:366 (-),score=65.84 gnl/TRDRNA2_/TRDRNA2_95896_c0_seq2:27-1124(-)